MTIPEKKRVDDGSADQPAKEEFLQFAPESEPKAPTDTSLSITQEPEVQSLEEPKTADTPAQTSPESISETVSEEIKPESDLEKITEEPEIAAEIDSSGEQVSADPKPEPEPEKPPKIAYFDPETITTKGSIGVRHLVWGKSHKEIQPPISKNSSHRFQIHLKSPANLKRLLPIIAANKDFSLSSYIAPKGPSAIIIKGRRIIGHISGSKPSTRQAKVVLRILGANIIYYGSRYDISLNPKKNLMKKDKRPLYFTYRGRLVRINRQLLKNKSAIDSFIKKINGTLFRRKVKILAIKK